MELFSFTCIFSADPTHSWEKKQEPSLSRSLVHLQ